MELTNLEPSRTISRKSELDTLIPAAYDRALENSVHLPASNPTRLALALNYSSFVRKTEVDRACQMATAAFDMAISEIQTKGVVLDEFDAFHPLAFVVSTSKQEQKYYECSLILHQLRSNWLKWSIEQNEEENNQPILDNDIALQVQERE